MLIWRGWALLASAILVSSAFAQEVKRPERLEGAIGADKETRSSSKVPAMDRPRKAGLAADGLIVLTNQWSLSPAGKHLELGDFPVNIALHPKLDVAAVLHSGQGRHEVITVDLENWSIVARVIVPQSFYGLCFSPDGGRLFASG